MTLKPIDSYCHLFSAHYAVEEAAAVGWAYVTGHYPHAGAVTRAAAAESLFSWDRLEDAVKWFFDLGTDFVLSSLMEVLSLEGYFRTFKKLFGTAALEELPANRQGDAGQNRQRRPSGKEKGACRGRPGRRRSASHPLPLNGKDVGRCDPDPQLLGKALGRRGLRLASLRLCAVQPGHRLVDGAQTGMGGPAPVPGPA